MRRALATLFLIAGLLATAADAVADQTDPRLDTLFDQLAAARNADAAAPIDAQIWTIWLESGDPEVDELVAQGVFALNAQEFPVALGLFDRVIERAPAFAEGWNKHATVHYLLGNHEESIASCERTLALEPRHYGALSGLGMIHMALGDQAAAITWFERALAANPHLDLVREWVERLRESLQGRPT